MISLRGKNAAMVLKRLNPIVRGWAMYYRTVVSSEAFAKLDRHVWQLTYKWAKLTHPNKPRHWVINRYFGRNNKSRHDNWVFGDREGGGYLVKHDWTKIVRHQMVRAGSSPDDPALADYWAARRRRTAPPPLDSLSLRLLQQQHGYCPVCGQFLLQADSPPQTPQQWEQWIRSTGKAINKRSIYQKRASPDGGTVRLVHTRCRKALS
jgi:RNA-directed DNA polymerase